MMNTKLKDAQLFYSSCALLFTARYELSELVGSDNVAQNLKADIKVLIGRINYLERTANNSLKGVDKNIWASQWSDRDYASFAEVLRIMCDMNEEQRAEMEQIAKELQKGDIKIVNDKNIAA